jgi:4-hydroxybenzoyl-CoA thioesterase
MSRTYVYPYRVGFGDCDAAGIVFYPRYFEMVNRTVETWFAGPLETSFAKLHMEQGGGVPTARFEVDFPAPSRLDDQLEFRLRITRLGPSSVSLLIEAHGEDKVRLVVRQTLVHVSNKTMKSLPWPDAMRARMTPFLIEA